MMRPEWGYTRQVEDGWKATTAPFVLFLNDDCLMNAGSIGALMAPMMDPKVGIVGPTITCGDYQSNPWAARVPTKDRYLPLYISVRHLIGACLLVRRSVLEEIGGWDTDMALHCSDLDLCIRTWQAGYRVIWAVRMVVAHVAHETLKEVPEDVFKELIAKDEKTLRDKHPNERFSLDKGHPRAHRRFGRAVYQALTDGNGHQTTKGVDNAYGQFIWTRTAPVELPTPEPNWPLRVGTRTFLVPDSES
jgi:GT2 family glycosyltransferase